MAVVVEQGRRITARAADLIRNAVDVATSKFVQRTVLYTVFIAGASMVLYGLAAIAYLLFYNKYMPDQVKTVPIHLQYGYDLHPYGIADVQALDLRRLQNYDVIVSMSLPRSPSNLETGNFMAELFLLSGGVPEPGLVPTKPTEILKTSSVIFRSFRPTIVPFQDPIVSLASTILFLPYHIFFPKSQKSTLVVPMAEGLFFNRYDALPTAVFLELTSSQVFQTYSVDVTFVARLTGLRWLMYHHWIFSFFVFTTMFFLMEEFVMLGTLTVMSLWLTKDPKGEGKQITLRGGSNKEQSGVKAEKLEEGDPSVLLRTLPFSAGSEASAAGMKQVAAGEEGGYEEDREDDEDPPTRTALSQGEIGSTSDRDSAVESGGLRRRSSQRLS